MKKIIILILAIIATVTVNAQQCDMYINGVGLEMEEVWMDEYGDYEVCVPGGGTFWGEKVKEGIRAKMEKVGIPECDYEAFKSDNGTHVLMAKNKDEWYDCITYYVVFKIFQDKSEFDLEVAKKVNDYNLAQESKKKELEEMERKHKIANDLGF